MIQTKNERKTLFEKKNEEKRNSRTMSEEEPLLSQPRGSAPSTSGVVVAGASADRNRARQAAALTENDDAQQEAGTNPHQHHRSWRGHLLLPCGSSYESLGVCCAVSACFPCPLLWPCVFR